MLDKMLDNKTANFIFERLKQLVVLIISKIDRHKYFIYKIYNKFRYKNI